MIEWDAYWEKYSVSKAEKWLILERDKILNTYLDKVHSEDSGKEVIEIGCGYGSNTRLIKRNRNDVKCYVLDKSNTAIEATKKEIPDAFLGDCRNTPFPDGKFDLIFSAGLMEHFKDEAPFLKEMERILKDNGYLITFIPAKFSLWQVYRLVHFGWWQHGYEKSYTYTALKSLFIHNGLDPIQIVGIDPFSINGFIMKLFNITFTPVIKRSILRSGYSELCVVGRKMRV